MLLIVVADTIINPWAMMVHPGNTALTSRTVMTLRYFYRITLLAPPREDGLQLSDFLRLEQVVVVYDGWLTFFLFLDFEGSLSNLFLFLRFEL